MLKFLPLIAAGLIAFATFGGDAYAQNSNPFAKTSLRSALVTIGPSCSPATAGCYIIPIKARGRA